jgi:hypothetical protein
VTPASALALVTMIALPGAPLRAQHAEPDAPHFAFGTAPYPQGGYPWESVVVDLNGDAFPDLATVSWPALNPRLSVLLGDGRGGFAPPVLYPLLDASHGIAAGDFDGDGDTDLAASITGKAFDNAFVSVFLNQGDGTLLETGPFLAGVGPTGLAAGDFDGDGDVDLAAAHDVDIVSIRRFAFLRNTGGGAFAQPVIRTLPRTSFAAAAGDLNGDRFADLVIAGEARDLSILLGTPDGPGTAVGLIALPGGFDPFPAVALADVDNDGDQDILFTAELAATQAFGGRGLAAILRNRGDGTFPAPETVQLGEFTGGAVGIAAADVTGDGWPDLLAAQGRDQLWTLVRGNGAGGFAQTAESWKSGEFPAAVHAADMDGDGDLDVINVAKGSQTANVHPNLGQGVFAHAHTTPMTALSIAPAFASLLRTGDLDRDGDLDAVIGYGSFFSEEWGIAVRLGNGDGTFGALAKYPTPVWPERIALADLEGDGDLDVLWLDDQFDKAVHWNVNLGNGTFGPPSSGPTAFCDFQAMDVGDLNEDGRPDVVAVSCFGAAEIAVATATGFAPWRSHPLFDFATAVELADLDADGHLDLVTNSALLGFLEVFLGKGDGTFTTPGNSFATGGDVAAIVAADLNGDGILDLAVAEENTNTMSVLLGRGEALFRRATTHEAQMSETVDNFDAIEAVDVDGDRDLDLVVASFGSQDLSLWRNRGDGTFDPQVRLGLQHNGINSAPGDYDGDGADDLLVLLQESVPNSQWWVPSTVLLHNLGTAAWTDLGRALPGTGGVSPRMLGQSTLLPGLPFALRTTRGVPGAAGALVLGASAVNAPFAGGVLVPSPVLALPFVLDADGTFVLAFEWPGAPSGFMLFAQSWVLDAGAMQGLAATNGVVGTVP